jgi:predicted nucleic acid-binding protein
MERRAEAVVDASVVVKWFSEEEGTGEAIRLRGEHVKGKCILSAPDLLVYEVSNALRYKPNFDEDKVGRAVADIIDLQIDLITPGRDLVDKAAVAAYKYKATMYDSFYLALGELMGIEVYTADKRFYNQAKASEILRLI